MDNSLTKKERLCGKSVIAELFQSNNSLFCYPFKCLWGIPPEFQNTKIEESNDSSSRVSVLFSVPKRKVKRANKRNLLKRRMKEAYRLNKHSLVELVQENNKNLNVALLYVAADIIEYPKIEAAIKTLLLEIEKANK